MDDFADELLGVTGPVAGRRVDPVDAKLEGSMYSRGRLTIV
jgi:hypothetical protein